MKRRGSVRRRKQGEGEESIRQDKFRQERGPNVGKDRMVQQRGEKEKKQDVAEMEEERTKVRSAVSFSRGG